MLVNRLGVQALQLVVIAALLGLWQLVSSTRVIDPFFISSPAMIAQRLADFLHTAGPASSATSIWEHIWITLKEAVQGYVLGAAAGVAIGFTLSQSRLLADVFLPLFNLANTLPRVALAPLFIVWFGFGESSKVFLVFTVVIVILVFNTYAGTQTVDQELVAVTRLLGAKRYHVLWKITLPSCLPWIFTGLRISLAWSIGAAVVGEYIGARAGMGYLIFFYAGVLDNTGLLAGCMVLLMMSFVLFSILNIVEMRVLRWRVYKY